MKFFQIWHTHKYIYIYLQIQEAEQIPKRINSKKSTPRHIKIKFLKTKNKNFQNQWEKNDISLSRENDLNDSRFLITNYWGWKEEARHFLSVKRTIIPEFYIQQQNKYPSGNEGWNSLVAQWLGLCASLQGHRFDPVSGN